MEIQDIYDERMKLKNITNKRRNNNKEINKKNIIENININCNLEALTKYMLIIIFFIILFFSLKFLLFNNDDNKIIINEDLYEIKQKEHKEKSESRIKKESPIQREESIINDKIMQLNISGTEQKNSSCFPRRNKLYWKNQTRIDIISARKEIKNKDFVKISFNNSHDFIKREKPKISIIITIQNQINFIETIYAHIQKQELKDIEIIFVDDASTDDSSLMIKKLMEKDKRIIYLKNDVNRHQFYSINNGVLNSSGEYILAIDPDDLIINNILLKAYKTATYYNLDILQFYIVQSKPFPILWKQVKFANGIICGNLNIRNIFYHGISRNICDKLIRRDIFLKSINFMKKEFYNEDYRIHPDDTIFFGIIRFANSYGFLEQIGYVYNLDPNRKKGREIYQKNLTEIANENMKSLFNIMKYFFVQSDDNEIEKNFIAFKFFIKKVVKENEHYVHNITKGFDFYLNVLDMYLNCSFYDEVKIEQILNFKQKILDREYDVKNRIK